MRGFIFPKFQPKQSHGDPFRAQNDFKNSGNYPKSPSPPTKKKWHGTDDQARDVLARLIYGFRISILFGFVLTFASMLIGVTAGAIQ